MTDETRGVDRRRLRFQRLTIGPETLKSEPAAFRVEEIEGRRRRAIRTGRVRETDAAIAGDDGSDALAQLRRDVAVGEQQAVVVCMRVDETRRGNETRLSSIQRSQRLTD